MEWISIKDRLPNKEESVLVIPPIGPVCIAYICGQTYSNKPQWYSSDGNCVFADVTHWMPLPAPPKLDYDLGWPQVYMTKEQLKEIYPDKPDERN